MKITSLSLKLGYIFKTIFDLKHSIESIDHTTCMAAKKSLNRSEYDGKCNRYYEYLFYNKAMNGIEEG